MDLYHEISLGNIFFQCYLVLGRRLLLSRLLFPQNINIGDIKLIATHQHCFLISRINLISLCFSDKAWTCSLKPPLRTRSYFQHSPCLWSVFNLLHSIIQPIVLTIFSKVFFRLCILSIFCQLPS
ncbi:uncharacterized protein LOC100504323 [Mus musculus]|jgi:hypothetical protein|uniref:Uncharacterized protein n=1 Tax=Mus musculus TaxID=10090 RepID=Q8BNC4_MOUSE|nr:uncharacterized protein LOC100504323 [Mus musculus]BAC39105.1 unnamed protein product [Mus musculus]BAE28663.1 unnamed protein product [Mus musculus]|eukprot:NP_001191842.1 uncharacterized protein LOC100504323 [Mus musculus]